MIFPLECLDVDILLYIYCCCVIKNMFKVLQKIVSREQISFKWTGPNPLSVSTMTLFSQFCFFLTILASKYLTSQKDSDRTQKGGQGQAT